MGQQTEGSACEDKLTRVHTHTHTLTHTHTHTGWFCFSGEPWLIQSPSTHFPTALAQLDGLGCDYLALTLNSLTCETGTAASQAK